MKNPVLRWALTISGVAIVVIVLFFLETMHRAWREFKEAEELYKKDDIPMAILCYGTVISFYTPGSPWVRKSMERLFEIGKNAEEKGDYKQAKEAYDEIIHRIYSIRSFYTPHKKKQERAMKLRDEAEKKIIE
ncbi:TPA: hypothetical protein DCX16_03985 [bacterium]|nr:hypothetical protein [bacterium]